MADQTAIPITLELDNIAELFTAPAVNPFSSHEIDISGEAGIDRLIKKAVKPWPLRQIPARIILRLPLTRSHPSSESRPARQCSATAPVRLLTTAASASWISRFRGRSW